MTENRKRVSVSVLRASASRTVSVAVLPVRVTDLTEAYDGPYLVTPGDAPVTLETCDLRMTDNVTVGAIPENYGKITWNGSVITVS